MQGNLRKTCSGLLRGVSHERVTYRILRRIPPINHLPKQSRKQIGQRFADPRAQNGISSPALEAGAETSGRFQQADAMGFAGTD